MVEATLCPGGGGIIAMALAARGDFLATSAATWPGAGAAVLAGACLAEATAVLAGEDLVALVTDEGAVFALDGFLTEGGVLTGVLNAVP